MSGMGGRYISLRAIRGAPPCIGIWVWEGGICMIGIDGARPPKMGCPQPPPGEHACALSELTGQIIPSPAAQAAR